MVVAIPTAIAFFGGAPDYLQYALRSAAERNHPAVLIGDASNRQLWSNHWDAGQSIPEKWRAFQETFTKMSDYPDAYEQSFWFRPFAVEQWMESCGVDEAFLLDSDVITFADYSRDIRRDLPEGCLAALMMYEGIREFEWAASLHMSYWTRPALADFTTFCIAAYRDRTIRQQLERKHRWHLATGTPGGICEMTLLYLWQQRHPGRVINLASIRNGTVADLAIGTANNRVENEYEVRYGLKRLVFQRGSPYGLNVAAGARVRFLCVHCQGRFKGLMRILANRRLRAFYRERESIAQVVVHSRAAVGHAWATVLMLIGLA